MKLTKRHLRKIILEEFGKIAEEEEPSPEHPEALESPLAEDDFNLEQIDLVATKLHDLIMWAMQHGYKPQR